MMQSVRAAEAETRRRLCRRHPRAGAARSTRGIPTPPATPSASARSRSPSDGRWNWPTTNWTSLRLGALLHDIGKIGVSDAVLRKPGALTPEEFEVIKQHPGVGARILRSVHFLAPHLPIVELHHERPDGKGYPHRLRGDEIPLLARIVHVADAFDAMT